MKLLKIINRRYLIFSVVIVILLGIALSQVLSHMADEQTNEKILTVYKRLTSQLDLGNQVNSFPPYFELSPIPNAENEQKFEDTTLASNQDEEPEEIAARQLTATYNTHGTTYKIVIRESKIESDDLFEFITLLVLIAILFLVVALYFVNSRITKSVWREFYENLNRVKNFSLQMQKPLELENTNIYEFKELNAILENLTNQVISDYKNLKQFTEDASHEIQTPLAIIRSKLETLLNNPELTEKQVNTLHVVYSSANQLSRINKSLILLAKLDNQQFDETSETSFQELINEKIDEWQELIELKQIDVDCNFLNDIRIKMNPSFSEILISNLLSNAINHNITLGIIHIQLDKNQLTISNSGKKKLINPEAVFNRFYKENPSSKSVGLGLAIVKKICDNHSIDINYTFHFNQHIFQLTFPQ